MAVALDRSVIASPAGDDVDSVVRAALEEDAGRGDATSDGLFEPDARCVAVITLGESGVVCGLDIAARIFATLDAGVRVQAEARDGERREAGSALARIEGRARAVLTGERTALNLLGRLSGVATLTSRYVDAIAGTDAVLLDTRKTTPGLRALEKYAVRCGGGTNHRHGLDDGILVKDNHLLLAGGVQAAVERFRSAGAGLPIEVECDTLDQVSEALEAGADRLLLDNMSLRQLREAVRLAGGRVPLEASGGITLDTVRAVAETGVDFVSVGALTRAARSLDVSLEVLP